MENSAVEACVSKFGELFPDVGADEFGNERVVMGDLDQAMLNSKSAGEFEFRYPNVAKMKISDDAYVCRGNLKSRVISSIESNGQQLAPEAGQNWSY